MKKAKIAVIGLSGQSIFLSVDHFHEKGETIEAYDSFVEPGGKGYNQAVAISKLGGECYFLTAVGNDEYGKICEDTLKKYGVKAKCIKKNNPTSIATILTDSSGENHVTVCKKAKLDLLDLIEFKSIIQKCDVLLLQLEIDEEINKSAINFALEKGVKVILNPAPAIIKDKSLLDKVDYLTPNQKEMSDLYGNNLDIKDSQTLVVTSGADETMIYKDMKITNVKPIKVTAVDTTGAGDVFNAALAIKIASKVPLVKAVEFANIAAGLSVTKKHVLDSIPTLNDINNYLNQ